MEVSVADTGPGLAPEVASHLFQPFVTTKRKGMGLGLSICRTIVEAHGGKIWVDNRPGGGTVFRFTLRAAADGGGRAWRLTEWFMSSTTTPTCASRWPSCSAPQALPCASTNSAVAFLKVLPEIKDGCVVTDVRMPGIDGLELQRRLGELERRLPVIVMTGHGDVPLAVEAMKAGAVDFIEKPFDDEVMLSAIRAALARQADDRERHARTAAIQERIARLSDRERDVLDRLVAGKANKVIAYELGISPRTVEVYRANVMTKMQADSLSELVRMALIESGAP